MRILEIETFGRGGLTHYAYNLSRSLAERGHELTLITGAGYELSDRDDPSRVRVLKPIGRASHRYGASLPATALSLLRKLEAIWDGFAVGSLARRLDPDVVHLHCTNPIALHYLGRLRRRGRALVQTAHVVTPHEPIALQSSVYRRIHAHGSLVIAHSNFDRDRLRREFGVSTDRVTVIPHGEYSFFDDTDSASVDRSTARRELGVEQDDEVALFFGHIREYKGLDVLLDAWPEVVRSRPAARLLVAGDPVQLAPQRRRELEQKATDVGALHYFQYIPFADVARFFKAADLVVMPYRHISQSGVLYVALALGLPVVATRVGALPEMLGEREISLLVPPESPDDLAAAISRALGDPDLRRRMAERGQALAHEHSWPTVAEQTERAFEALLAT